MNLEKQESIRHRREFLKKMMFLLAGVVVVVFVWLTAESYHRLLGEEEIKQTKELLKKIDPRLNMEVMDRLESMEKFSIDEVDRQLAKQALSLSMESRGKLSVSTKSANIASGAGQGKAVSDEK